MKTVKQIAVELNRAPSTIIKFAREVNAAPDGVNSPIGSVAEGLIRDISSKRRRVVRKNSPLYAGGLQQTLRLDGEAQTSAATPTPEPEANPAAGNIPGPYIFGRLCVNANCHNQNGYMYSKGCPVCLRPGGAAGKLLAGNITTRELCGCGTFKVIREGKTLCPICQAPKKVNPAAVSVEVSDKFRALCVIIDGTPREVLEKMATALVDYINEENGDIARTVRLWRLK